MIKEAEVITSVFFNRRIMNTISNLAIKQLKNNKISLFKDNKKVGYVTYDINSFNASIYINIYNVNNYQKNLLIKLVLRHLFISFNLNNITFDNKVVTSSEFFFLNKYDVLLFDIDDTLLSFSKTERMALTKALNKVNVKADEKIIETYHKINIACWEEVEKNIISRQECLTKRFDIFLPLYNIDFPSKDFEDLYRSNLDNYAYLVKDAKYVLNHLKENFAIYAITNGVKLTQVKRVRKAKLNKYFIKSFISEEIGYNKPSIYFFKAVKDYIKDLSLSKTLIIGDSLTSDIKLGHNNNVDTCWFNLYYQENTKQIIPTYQINELKELLLHYKN